MALSADQIKSQYSGYAGWNDPAAIVADYNATGGAGKGGPASSGGYSGGSSGGFDAYLQQSLKFLQYKKTLKP